MINKLLADIERFCLQKDIKESYFGLLAVNHGGFVGGLRDGKGITAARIEKVRKFIKDNAKTEYKNATR